MLGALFSSLALMLVPLKCGFEFAASRPGCRREGVPGANRECSALSLSVLPALGCGAGEEEGKPEVVPSQVGAWWLCP